MMGKKFRKGVTLVEVVVSISIIAIVIGPLLNICRANECIVKKSRDEFFANQLAQKYMEEYKYNQIVDSEDCTEYFENKEFEIRIDLKDYKMSKLQEIIVTVSDKEGCILARIISSKNKRESNHD